MTSESVAERVSRTKGREATKGVIPGRFALSVGLPELPAPNGWKWTALSAVAQLESGHTPSRKHPEYWNEGIPWIGIKDAVDNHGREISETYQHVSHLGLENSSARLLPPRTVCLSRTASVGYVVLMGRSMATSQDFVNWVCGPQLDPDYLKYVLLAERDSLLRFASGTTHQTIYYPEAKAFHALLPPVAEQRNIVRILGGLDDKIELNRKMNQTLEEMARALFKSWFVDFDPVRAKAADKKPYGMHDATAALFPDSFEESELGEIPKGWRASNLGAEALRCGGIVQTGPFGSQLHASDYVAAGVPVVMPRDIVGRRVSTERIARVREADADRLSKHRLQLGDLVYSRRGDVERHALVSERETGWLCGTGCLLVRLGPRWPSPAFASLALDRPESRGWISQHAIGATMPNLNTSILSAAPFVVPPAQLIAAFARVVDPLDRLRAIRDAESATLATVRDSLLPKLLSGEISAVAGERQVSAVA